MDATERAAFEAFCIEWAKATCTYRSVWDVVEQTYRHLRPEEWRKNLDLGTRNMLTTAWKAGVQFAKTKAA